VTAAQLFNTPEMALRYPMEIEVRRDGADEGEGRGFDNMDLSAAAERSIATSDAAALVMSWFAAQLIALGWRDDGHGWFRRDEGETFVARIDRDRRGCLALVERWRRMQENFEVALYPGAPRSWSVVTVSLIVAPGSDHVRP
jgi:hypothetical protein